MKKIWILSILALVALGCHKENNITPEPEVPEVEPDGTEAAPYLIADKAQLLAVHDLLVDGEMVYFKMTADVDLDGEEWEPLNNASPFTKYICFDGGGKTISNFTSSGSLPSFFGVLNGQVKDLTITGATVTGTTDACGVLASEIGCNDDSEMIPVVENVTISGCTVGSADFNGVGGVLAGKILKGGTTVKGVTVSNCTVTSKNNYVGGLIGYVSVTSRIDNCRVSGSTISGKDIVGGMFGCFGNVVYVPTCSSCFVDNCTVSGTYRRIGGFAGWHQSGKIARCGVESDVSATSPKYDVGGFTGFQDTNATLENSYSRADATGNENVGGLVGRSFGSVQNCYASGTPTATSDSKISGGLIGLQSNAASDLNCISWNSSLPLTNKMENGTITNCYTKAADETGTVSTHAQALGWSDVVWDFSSDFPTLTGADAPEPPHPSEYAYHIIPYPNKLTPGSGSYRIGGDPVSYDMSFAADVIEPISEFASKLRLTASRVPYETSSGINFMKNNALGPEAYSITITENKVLVKVSSRAGVLYAIQTLKQLLPSASYVGGVDTADWTIPCLTIEDEPRFRWRGMHLDVSRHFFTVDEIKHYLDIMALYKLNRFHWHLTDDQGWRVEIDGDEALTQLGAYRGTSHPAYPGHDRDNGFYTKEDIAEIVNYAHKKGIIVVPEVDLPGHAAALLTAHNDLACTCTFNFDVWDYFGINPDLLCVAKATAGETKDILDNIVKQLALLFPDSEYIHFGGDETRTGSSFSNSWKRCDACTALMNELGLSDAGSVTKEMRLQYYFTKYMCALAAKYGKKMIGWQEVFSDIRNSSDFSADDLPGLCVESWTQAGHGLNACKAGLYGMVAPSYSHYLSYGQDPNGDVNRNVLMNECYTLTLNGGTGLTQEEEARFLGTEGCMWTENLTSMEDLEFQLLPRLGAVAEVAWTKPENKDYDRFKESLVNTHFPIYDALGLNYRKTVDF